METKEKPKYKNLYQMLGSLNYMLNNQIEQELFKNGDYNEELYTALSEFSREDEYKQDLQRLELRNLNNQEEWDKLVEQNPKENLNFLIDKELIGDDLLEEVQESIEETILEGCEIYQTFIVDDDTMEILQDYGQFVYTIEDASLNLWGVMHYGTHWSMIMNTNYPVQNEDRYIYKAD